MAGRKRRPGLLDEWRSHLAGRPGHKLTNWEKTRDAAGFILSALKMRLRDLADLAWVPADRVLSSRTLSNLVVLVPTVAEAATILIHAGAMGIMESMEDLAATIGMMYGLIRLGRWWRDVKPPDPKPYRED
jgi:hypothetical protein